MYGLLVFLRWFDNNLRRDSSGLAVTRNMWYRHEYRHRLQPNLKAWHVKSYYIQYLNLKACVGILSTVDS